MTVIRCVWFNREAGKNHTGHSSRNNITILQEEPIMNRENKRKQFEKGYYKTHSCTDIFTCRGCGRMVGPGGGQMR